MKKFTYIDIHPSGDGYQVIFLDDRVLLSGDDYHDKVRDQYEGIQNYLAHIGEDFEQETISLETKNPNKYWHDYKYQVLEWESVQNYLKRLSRSFHKV